MTNRDWTCPIQTVDYVPVSGEDVTDVCERYADWWVVEADRCKGVESCYQRRTCLHMFCQPVTAVVYRDHSSNNTLHHYSKHGVKEINTELSYIIYLVEIFLLQRTDRIHIYDHLQITLVYFVVQYVWNRMMINFRVEDCKLSFSTSFTAWFFFRFFSHDSLVCHKRWLKRAVCWTRPCKPRSSVITGMAR